MKKVSAFIVVLSVTGCATTPKEDPITASIKAPIPQIQFNIEDISRAKAPQSKITQQTDSTMVITNDCMNLESMDAFKCSIVMMGIGNTGWSGPFHIQTYRFASIEGETKVRGGWQWCAISGFGVENCMPINPAGPNMVLRSLIEKHAIKNLVTTDGAAQ